MKVGRGRGSSPPLPLNLGVQSAAYFSLPCPSFLLLELWNLPKSWAAYLLSLDVLPGGTGNLLLWSDPNPSLRDSVTLVGLGWRAGRKP